MKKLLLGVAFVKHSYIRPSCAVIGEPTSLKPIPGTIKGHIGEALRITGRVGILAI